MRLFLDSFWRALAYCLMPRVMLLSLLPLVMLLALTLSLGYFYWQPTQDWVRGMLDSWQMLQSMMDWLQARGAGGLQSVMVQLVIIFAITPVLVIVSLLAVSLMMSPALVNLVVDRRFQHLSRKQGGTMLSSLMWTLGYTLAAMLAMLISLPLWVVPPLMFVVPPLIWGWLSYRVMVYDALLAHASREERLTIGRRHRGWLLLMGVLTGYMGALPSMVWASGAFFAAAFVVLVPLAIWIYALVFAFTSLWFTHYSLAALESLRAESDFVVVGASEPLPALALQDEPHAIPPVV
ncbi:EI24 domain-containing protein [Limnohabitans sp.]|uniref:EI24 domain-containing protein n=1 Tax=Limnohabitans sp. TaxID=1907725 RepID=UPI00286EE4D4|nr:EI24 domain-containing protein [Limnohabitans sp.]